MTDLTEFLTARLDEDEAVARAGWTRGQGMPDLPQGWTADPTPELVAYNKRFSPARVLREVESNRAIVTRLSAGMPEEDVMDGFEHEGWEAATRLTLTHLAAVYSDHEDFREEWRP